MRRFSNGKMGQRDKTLHRSGREYTPRIVTRNAYASKGDYDRAIADYNRAIQIDPDNAVAYNNRGIAYWRLNDKINARRSFQKAKELGHLLYSLSRIWN